MIYPEMPNARARILWLSAREMALSPGLEGALAKARYALCSDDQRPDITVIDVRGSEDDRVRISELVREGRTVGAKAGHILLADAGASKRDRDFLARHGDVTYLRSAGGSSIGPIRERLRLAALAEETGERIKSIVADGRQTDFSKLSEQSKRLSILIAGRPSPLTLAACNAVSSAAAETFCVLSAGQAMRALDSGAANAAPFDGALFMPRDEKDILTPLARALRRHREHRRLPVIFTSEDEALLDRLAAYDSFETIAARHIGDDLLRRIELAAKKARMAAAMRSFLRSPEATGGGGAASAKFFAAHAIRLLKRADESNRRTAFVTLSIEPRAPTVNHDHLSAALNDAIKTSTRLVRAEDMLARLAPNIFVVLLPGVCGDDAERVARRLEGLVSGTASRSTLDISELRTAHFERQPQEPLEHAIAALMRKLKEPRSGSFAV